MFAGRVFGIPVYVGPSWFLVALLITMLYAPTVERWVAGIGAARYLVAFCFALLLYFSVLLHELGHSLVARALGLPIRRISIHGFVGLSEIEREPETPGREALVAAAGPAVSLVLAAAGVVGVRLLDVGTVPWLLISAVTVSNLLVTVLNVLPGLPLDGGRVLRAAVWRASHNALTGTTVAAWAGRVVAIAIAALGVLWALRSGATDSSALFDAFLALLIGAFVWSGATASLHSAKVRAVLPELSARGLARRALAVPADLPVAEALRRLSLDGAQALVVVDSSGAPTAIVSEAAVSATPEVRRPWLSVSTLARGVTPGMRLRDDLSGVELVQALQENPADEYLVVDAAGGLHGVLVAADVAAVMNRAVRR